ncbi:hypothetical protein RB653_010186 [Dictyostelium firmibasis]|uniref:Prokaryotic-type class I peptide chain release factors domain-containing protein n=1 Tax=Dictyostelium firmibasis TaxID=79012 RepID=A0AAN7TSG9_9MYCE
MNKINIIKSIIPINSNLNHLNNYNNYICKELLKTTTTTTTTTTRTTISLFYNQRYYSNTYKDKKEKYDDDDNTQLPPPKIIVPKDKLNLQFSRSSGAGGQNVNKVNTKVEVRFDLNKADWIPPYVKVNMKRFYKKNVNDFDEFIITSSKHRYQHLNISDAMDKLDDILKECQFVEKERVATEIPYYANEKRLLNKSIKKDVKQSRKKLSTSKYFDRE